MERDRETTLDVATCRASLLTRQEQQAWVREQRRQAALQAAYGAVRSALPCFPCVGRAYLFGSVVRSKAMRSTSDVDLAVEGNLSAEEYFALWRELENAAVGWPIDLVELDRASRFAVLVRERGVLIYERSDSDIESGDGR